MLSRVLRLRSCPLLSRTFSSQNYPPHEVLPMPALSPTMEIGGIARWSIQEGASFSAGDVMFECETDKATVDYEATDDGFLAKILLQDGSSDVAVGTPLAVTVEEAGDVAAFADYVTEPVATTNSQTPSSTLSSPPPTPPPQTGQSPLSHAGRTPSIQFRHGARDEINAALGRMAASAVGGNNNAAAAASLSTEDILKDPRGYQDVPLTAMRKIIAARLTESKATIPHYYSRMECNIDHMLSYRKTLKDVGVKVSVNDLVIVAAALALRDVPEANSFWNGASIEKNDTVDISVAVATEGGLITPIVKDADRIGLSAVNQSVADLAGRARQGKLAPEEYNGGSFTISNLGMFGISEFTAVINPPQACILAVGGGSPTATVGSTASELEKDTIMTVVLSADRRVVDDHIAAQFLQVFRTYCEKPSLMAV